MSDISNTTSQRDTRGRSSDEDTRTFTEVFGELRPIELRQELPAEILKSISGRSPLFVQLLYNRGISGAEAVGAFLNSNWHSSGQALLHLARAVERIHCAIADGEQIAVYGDFDCDGITSCTLLTLALTALGAMVTSYIPRRDDDGRGLNSDAIRELAARGTHLCITTDCGTANVAEIELARSLNIQVIVTDHHPPHGPLAPAYAIVNPWQEGDDSPERELAGVGVAFRLAEALLADTPASESTLASLLDLVAIGTIADVVPLSPSNWGLVRAGLRQIRLAPRPGVRAMLDMAHLRPDGIVARDVSFGLAPRINACGRMGQPELALGLMLATEAEEATRLAQRVEILNAQRQAITDTIVAAAREQAVDCDAAETNVVIAQGDRWPLGVLGLVAGRLVEEYHRPVFVISQNGSECRGSARGPAGIDLGAVLEVRSDFFKRFGGHAQAAGFALATETLPEFLSYLQACFSTPADASGEVASNLARTMVPVVADCRLALQRLVPESSVYADLDALEPFGVGFAEPVFVCPSARIIGCRRSGVEGRTLRLRLAYGGTTREFIWSRRGEVCERLRAGLGNLPLVDVAFALRKYQRSGSGAPEWLAHIETVAPAVAQV